MGLTVYSCWEDSLDEKAFLELWPASVAATCGWPRPAPWLDLFRLSALENWDPRAICKVLYGLIGRVVLCLLHMFISLVAVTNDKEKTGGDFSTSLNSDLQEVPAVLVTNNGVAKLLVPSCSLLGIRSSCFLLVRNTRLAIISLHKYFCIFP